MDSKPDHEIVGGNTFKCNKTDGNSMPAKGHLPEYCPYCREGLKFFEWLDETNWIENRIDKADALFNDKEVELLIPVRDGYMYKIRYLEGEKRGDIITVNPGELEEL